MKIRLLGLLFVVNGAFLLSGQGMFQNLDFEEAKLILITNGPVSYGSISIATTNALPGWTAFDGTNQLSTVYYRDIGAIPPVELLTSNAAISGNFSVWLGDRTASISQTGLVPTDAQSLLFEMLVGGSFAVSLGGQTLSYQEIATGLGSSGLGPAALYAADISSFAGQTETLSFSGTGFMDDIQFSSQPIPEPSALSLIVVVDGVLASICACRRRARRLGSKRVECRL